MKVSGVASMTSVNVLTEAALRLSTTDVAEHVMVATGAVWLAIVQAASLLHSSAGPGVSSRVFTIWSWTLPGESVDTRMPSVSLKGASVALEVACRAPPTTATWREPVAALDGPAVATRPLRPSAMARVGVMRRRMRTPGEGVGSL